MKLNIVFNKNIINKWRIKFVPFAIFKKNFKNFYNKYTGCKNCKGKRSLKRYYGKKDKISNQQELNFEKREIKFYKIKIIER